MIQWSQDQIMKGLRELVTEIEHLEKADNVDGKSGGIITTTEDACIFKDIPPFNHDLEYGEMLVSEGTRIIPDHSGMKVKEMYIYGIHREILSNLIIRVFSAFPEQQCNTVMPFRIPSSLLKPTVNLSMYSIDVHLFYFHSTVIWNYACAFRYQHLTIF